MVRWARLLLCGAIAIRVILGMRFSVRATGLEVARATGDDLGPWVCKGADTNRDEVEAVPLLKLSKVPNPSHEMDVLKDLFQPLGIGRIGRGLDVAQNRTPYNKLEFLTAWKVESSPELSMYQQEKERLQEKRKRDDAELWVDTCRNDVQQKARDQSMTDENEYLMMRGFKAKRLMENLCQNSPTAPRRNPYNANYGWGFYFSDASDKTDQYTGESVAGSNRKHIESVLGQLPGPNSMREELEELANDPSAQDILFAPVVRAYLGKHIELQIDYQSCFTKQKDEERERVWYYHDPQAKQHTIIHDIPPYPRSEDREPPYKDWDSVKVMTTAMNPEYSTNIRPGASLSPNRHNEFFVPRREQFAVQYIVAYARKWDKDHPSKPIPCRCHRHNPDKECPWKKPHRPPCTPCKDGWEYRGRKGRKTPDWGEDEVLPTCNSTIT